MANEDHLAILNEGVKTWNRWRAEHPRRKPKLSQAPRKRASFQAADDPYHVDLSGANLSEANLCEANLAGVDLSKANLDMAKLSDADLSHAHLIQTSLRDANLNGAYLADSDLIGAILNGADLHDTDLSRARLNGAKVSCANLTGANLNGAILGDTLLVVTDLSGASLRGSTLNGTLFWGADMRGADLSAAHMHQAQFWGADLSEANLKLSSLHRVNLRDANFSGTRLGSTMFAECDLSGVRGLDFVTHQGPSTIGIDTLYASNGKISDIFLRGCGVPDALITQTSSLVQALDGIQFYSCFISYSSKEEDFAKRLHGQMRDAHLRVWFAPEDVEAGKKLHEQIETAIRIYDKLLIVLSEASLQSEWVMDELRKGFRAERDTGTRKLFPVRLVSYETLQGWECRDSVSGKDLAEEVRQYFIPDFSNWKDHDQFEAAFARLLKDLRAEEPAK